MIFRNVLLWMACLPLPLFAQINTDRVMEVGKNALYMEDYALSIQYFNQVVYAKPYLYDPYFYRGLAKFYLEDFQGADEDLTHAVDINPFIQGTYQLRGLVRIRLADYDGAIADYKKAISFSPDNQGFYQNLALCYIQKKDYANATLTIDNALKRWPKFSKGYAMKADMALQQKDYKSAAQWLDKTLALDPYEGSAWETKAFLSVQEKKYHDADREFTKALSLLPKTANLYINRALSRYRIFNYRGAMSDYSSALNLDPSNYIAHYNRALLSMQVGEDNQAIKDLNFLIGEDPGDMLAIYNRATLREKTGDYRGAIRDYTRLIDHFPSFWTGYMARAALKRKMGDTKGADLDEFHVLRAQMDKTYNGKRYAVRHYDTRRSVPTATRKQSSKKLDDYDKMVEADEAEPEKHYDTDYTGAVQNRKASIALQPMFALSYYTQGNGVRDAVNFYKGVDDFNRRSVLPSPLLITNYEPALEKQAMQKHFDAIDRTTAKIDAGSTAASLYFSRAMDEYSVRDFKKAMSDLDSTIVRDPQAYLALFMRATLRTEMQAVTDVKDQTVAQMNFSLGKADLDEVIRLAPDFAYAYFNRGALFAGVKDYKSAIADYDRAIRLTPDFAEAYYNRGLVEIFSGNVAKGRADLSKAGELGLYTAYSVIKHYSNAK